MAHGPVRRLLRDVLQLLVGTVGLLLATAVRPETVDDHFDGALYDETGKTHTNIIFKSLSIYTSLALQHI